MGRRTQGWWDDRRGRWLARLGPVSPRTGKKTPVALTDADDRPIAREDLAGRDAAIARLLARPTPESRGPTVAEVCRLYLAWEKEQGIADSTIKTHWYNLGRFAAFEHGGVRYADRAAASIVPRDLARCRKAGVGAIRHLYMSVMACWHWAARPIDDREPERLIPANPLAGMIRPKGGQNPSQTIPWPLARRVLRMARGWARTPARTRKARTRATRWLRVQALVGIAYSGARTAEMVTLEWGDIRWSEGVAAIPAERTKTRRTGRMRYIPLLPRLVKLLRVIERWPHRHDRYVFACRWHDGPGLKTWWESLREGLIPYLEERGVELPEGYRVYWIRHTVATQASRAVGKEQASKALGHSAQVMDAVYDHVEADRVREVGEAIERARRGARRPPDA